MFEKVREELQMLDEGRGSIELTYFVRTFDEYEGQTAYGIKIEGRNAGSSDYISEETLGITFSYEEAVEWIHMLADGKATPTHLHALEAELVG